jgi:MFS family permease
VSPTFRSLHEHNYRLWASGAIVSNTGTWMQRVAQDWLVLTVLTENSGTAVGITTGLQFAPALLLSPVAGALADRMDRRKLLVSTQTASGALALGLGLLVTTGLAQLWHVYVFALLLGVVGAVDAPARQAFVSELVPNADLPNAVGLNSASFHAGRLIGPGIAGLLIHWFGTGPVFLINAVSFGAVVVSLLRMRTGELRAVPRPERGGHPVRDGLEYVRRRADIVLTLVIIGMVGTFGLNFQLTTALMARLVFHKGAGEYGLLGSVMAVGSLAGALLAARREHPRLRLVIGAAIAFGVFATVSALMPTYELFALSLIPVGLSSLTLMTAANASVQMSTEPAMRGRVMSLYIAVFMGGTPLGSPVIGWVGEHFGARWTILMGGIAALVTAAAALAWLVLHKGVRVRYRRTGLVVTPPTSAPSASLPPASLPPASSPPTSSHGSADRIPEGAVASGSLNRRPGENVTDVSTRRAGAGRPRPASAGRGTDDRSRPRPRYGVGEGGARR